MDFRHGAVIVDDIAGGGEKAGDIFGCKGEAVIGKSVVADEDQRYDDEQQRPDGIGRQRRAEDAALPQRRAFFHASSSSPGSESSSSSLEKQE